MASVEEILQKYVDKDYNELFESASRSFALMHDVYTETFNDSQKATRMLTTLIFTAVASDGTLSALEAKFLNELAGSNFTTDELIAIARDFRSEQAIECADDIFDAMPENAKAELFNLSLCVCAIDERISREEIEYIFRLVD